MKLFQLPKYDFKAVGICPNVSKCMQIWRKWLYIIQIGTKLYEVPHKFKIENAIWSSPEMTKAVWSYPKLNNNVPLCPNLNGAIVVWPELI